MESFRHLHNLPGVKSTAAGVETDEGTRNLGSVISGIFCLSFPLS